MKPLSTRLKVALLSAGMSGIVLSAFGAAMWGYIYHLRVQAVDREIRTFATQHRGLFAGRANYDRLSSSLEFTFGDDYTNKVILALRDAAGMSLYVSPHWPADLSLRRLLATMPLKSPIPQATSTTNANNSGEIPWGERRGTGWGYGRGRGGPPPEIAFSGPARFSTMTANDSKWRIGMMENEQLGLIIGLNQADLDRELNRLRNAFLAGLPVALLLVGLGGWIVAGRALHPLATIAATAEQVTAHGLDRRIPDSGAGSPEAARLIQVLNRMMDRLEASFRQATRFSADASHELKTPLAVMQGELENALQAATPGSAEQQLFSNLLEEIHRLKTITRSLLLLAQADAGQLKLSIESVELSAELEEILEDARVLAAGSDIRFESQLQPSIICSADVALLRTALLNVVHNAIKYNEPGGRLEISLSRANGAAVVAVGNSGPGIPESDRRRVFDRFHRVNRARPAAPEGVGLGLSLAREIVRAHRGDLVLKESRPGWTCFVLTLPLAQS